jgi:hypothetical protein
MGKKHKNINYTTRNDDQCTKEEKKHVLSQHKIPTEEGCGYRASQGW